MLATLHGWSRLPHVVEKREAGSAGAFTGDGLPFCHLASDRRMNLSDMFTEDQMAVLFCLGALTICGLIAAASYHFGPVGREERRLRKQTGQSPQPATAVDPVEHRRAA
jgi:hypothetical protein